MPRISEDSGAKQFLVQRKSRPTNTDSRVDSMALVPRKTHGPHPSTERALVLRRDAYGTGEVMLAKKISGQEKLALLADEMVRTAVRRPFDMDELLRMVDSQMGVHVDEIADLKDPEPFYDDLTTTLKAITPLNERPPINDTCWIAEAVGTRMHNVYLLAGSWRIVRDVLKQLEALRLDVSDLRGDLQARETVRERYLVLYDMVTAIARLGQQRLANITARSAHYAPYFVTRVSAFQATEMQFDYGGKNLRKLREAHKSFIDALILELALPNSEYPPYILMALLHDAVEECRKEQNRFSQALWDAVGDFSITIQILDIMEGPLLGMQGEEWIRNTKISQEYKNFLRAEELSSRASKDIEGWRQYFSPLINVKKKDMHDRLWQAIEKSYKKATGMGIDALWSLQSDLQTPPQWSATFLNVNPTGQSDDKENGALVFHPKRKAQITSNRYPRNSDESDDDEMPGLMTASDSSDDLDPISEGTEGGDVESEFDPEEDEDLQEQLKEALEAFDELLDPDATFITMDKKSSNPFTRMFAHLKDRYFASDPALHASEKSRNPFKSRPGAAAPAPSQKPFVVEKAGVLNTDLEMPALEPIRPPKPKTPVMPQPAVKPDTAIDAFESELELPPLVALGEKFNTRKPHNVTMVEVEDEDADASTKKKKKKKKKSKKAVDTPEPLQPHVSSTPSSPISPLKGISTKGSPMKQPVVAPFVGTSQSNFSTTSLPLHQETVAQSAHSYLQAKNLTPEKTKVKSRPAFSTGFFKSSDKDKKSGKIEENKDEKQGILGRIKKIHLPKKASDLMSRLVGAAGGKTGGKKSMKWEDFLKVMRAMGFKYEPSTAGSSVRFDPPDPKDSPVTFHKPHPDPTLDRRRLREFGRKLVRRYGWKQEMFNTFGVAEGEESGEGND